MRAPGEVAALLVLMLVSLNTDGDTTAVEVTVATASRPQGRVLAHVAGNVKLLCNYFVNS